MHPPYTEAYEAKYRQALDYTLKGEPRDPTGGCVPPGMPRMMSDLYAMDFVITPRSVAILMEYPYSYRQIFTDGRKHEPDADLSYGGDSIGHWRGQTLVVETVGLRDDTIFDRTGAPHSDQLKVVEEIRLRDANTLEDKMTMIDPVAFTKPWTVTRTYRRHTDWRIREFVCEENNRNPIGTDHKGQFILNQSAKPAN